jgi:hypothetical protein
LRSLHTFLTSSRKIGGNIQIRSLTTEYYIATGRWFSPGPPISFTNKTDRHDIAEILLKVALNTLKPTNQQNIIGKNKMGKKMVGIIPQSNKKLQNCKSIYSTPNTQIHDNLLGLGTGTSMKRVTELN